MPVNKLRFLLQLNSGPISSTSNCKKGGEYFQHLISAAFDSTEGRRIVHVFLDKTTIMCMHNHII